MFQTLLKSFAFVVLIFLTLAYVLVLEFDADATVSEIGSSEALWISDPSDQFVSEVSETDTSGTPAAALSVGIPQGSPGKPSFDTSGDLWVPLCGDFTDPQGSVVALQALHST